MDWVGVKGSLDPLEKKGPRYTVEKKLGEPQSWHEHGEMPWVPIG
jgi:hypothetical protein